MTFQNQSQELVDSFFSIINRQYVPDDVIDAEVFNSSFYVDMHNSSEMYQQNNWFGDKYIEILKQNNFKTVFELGSGNGLATKKLSTFCDKVISCDWNPNPYCSLENIDFHNCSLFDLPRGITADVSISADVIEHFPQDKLHKLCGRLDNIAPNGLHIIAGYADGTSHLSVLSPWDWLKIFRCFDEKYRLIEIDARRGNWKTPVFVFSNFL